MSSDAKLREAIQTTREWLICRSDLPVKDVLDSLALVVGAAESTLSPPPIKHTRYVAVMVGTEMGYPTQADLHHALKHSVSSYVVGTVTWETPS